jgi:hypothetical protein
MLPWMRAAAFILLLPLSLAMAAGDLDRRSVHGLLIFQHPEGLEPLAADLARQVQDTVRAMSAELGPRASGPVNVLMAADRDSLERAAPVSVRMPAWAAGMALPRQGVILLRVGGGRPIEDIRQTFLHEYAHLGLHRAASGARLPRWFQEGYAMLRAGQWNFQRSASLARGVLSGRLYSLEALTERFVGEGDDVELAYAQSIDFLGFLLARNGPNAFAETLARLGRGEPFLSALEEAYDRPLLALEEEWRADLASRFRWFTVLAGTSALWIAASLIFLLAYLRRRRARRLAMDAMEDDPDWVEPPPPDNSSGPPPLLH